MSEGHIYKLKDKKIRIARKTATKVSGVTTYTWDWIHEGQIWAFYQQNGGAMSLEGSSTSVKFYSSKERATFVINNRADFKPKATDVVYFNSKFYTVTVVDDYQGYKEDLKLNCELATDQDPAKYSGLVI